MKKRYFSTVPALVLFPATVLACPNCYSNIEGDIVGAMRWGIVVLLTILVAVLGSFALFFVYLWRQGKKAEGRHV